VDRPGRFPGRLRKPRCCAFGTAARARGPFRGSPSRMGAPSGERICRLLSAAGVLCLLRPRPGAPRSVLPLPRIGRAAASTSDAAPGRLVQGARVELESRLTKRSPSRSPEGLTAALSGRECGPLWLRYAQRRCSSTHPSRKATTQRSAPPSRRAGAALHAKPIESVLSMTGSETPPIPTLRVCFVEAGSW
jgi:hypothetical protein